VFDRAFDSLQSLFNEFSFRRLLFWLFVVLVLAIAAIAYTYAADPLFYDQMQKRTALLRELEAMREAGIATDPDVGPIYRRLVTDLAAHDTRAAYLGFPLATLAEPMLKFLSGAAIGIVGVIAALVEKAQGGADWKSTLGGAALIIVICGPLGALVPTIGSPWVNAALYIGLQIAVIILNSRTMPSTVSSN
jgi:hypothetical protein